MPFNKIVFFVLLSVFAITPATPAISDDFVLINGQKAVAGRLLLQLEPDANQELIFSSLMSMEIRPVESSNFFGIRSPLKAGNISKSQSAFWIAQFDSTIHPVDAARAIMEIEGIQSAQPDYLYELMYAFNDPYYIERQQNFRQVGYERIWNVTFGQGIIVAVLDTGYRYNDMTDPVPTGQLLDGYDFNARDDDIMDFQGHGTFITHMFAEATDNEYGCAGATPDVQILPLKVFPDEEGGAETSDIADAVAYAVDHGANVINMSFGGSNDDPVMTTALAEALSAGVFLAAASGNKGEMDISYPAREETVMAVGSCNMHEFGEMPVVSDFSNYGPEMDVVAPGEDIIQETWTNGNGPGFYRSEGTSMSVPHVSAAAALMMALGGVGDPEGVADAIRETAVKGGSGDWDIELGYGELNAYEAVALYYGDLPNSAPKADASATQAAAYIDEVVILSAEDCTDDDGNIVSYFWELSDGQMAEGKTSEITFNSKGTYTATLTVRDAEGESDQDKTQIDIREREEEEEDGCGC